MSDWGVAGFVSRVAQSVTTAGEGLAAQLAERSGNDDAPGMAFLAVAFPYVEPAPAYLVALRQQLMTAPIVVEEVALVRWPFADRRVVYGVAAFGSLASAVVVAYLLRNRGAHRFAA